MLLSIVITPLSMSAQNKREIIIKAGPSLCNMEQSDKSGQYYDSDRQFIYGFAFSVENQNKPFGKNKRLRRTEELGYYQKGGHNGLEYWSHSGSDLNLLYESVPVKLDYLSLSENLKFFCYRRFYFKVGARMDYLVNFKSEAVHGFDSGTKNSFNPFTGGINYGFGYTNTYKKIGIVIEFSGHNDFSYSGNAPKTYYDYINNCYTLAVGLHYSLCKTE